MRKYFLAAGIISVLVLICFFWGETFWALCRQYGDLLTDKERLGAFIRSFGYMAPVAFIVFQVLQVIFAPFPGEISGFLGGYLFGTLKGFICSTIGLTMGSWINFLIGRFLGRPFVLRHIPQKQRNRFEQLLKKDGGWLLFVLFVFPGFPKDYLCLFLGLSAMPIKIFLLLSTIGRMPGTLLLSLQGASLLEGAYVTFLTLTTICLVLTGLACRYRDVFLKWIEKYNDR